MRIVLLRHLDVTETLLDALKICTVLQLTKTRGAIEHDLLPALHGLRATWQEMLDLRRKFLADPDFRFMPTFPAHSQAATNVASGQ